MKRGFNDRSVKEGPSYVGPGPCELGCPQFERCKTERLACRAFEIFVRSGLLREPREPDRETYLGIFDEPQYEIVRIPPTTQAYENMLDEWMENVG